MSRLLLALNLRRNLIQNRQLIKSLINSNSTRCLATKTPVPSQEKQQWERDDRFKIFYGFDNKNEAQDKASAHFFTFVCVLGFFFVPGVLLYYYPDYKTNDWCYREAHLELARREKAGEPLVSPDYVPSETIKLPSDEEIGDMEIVI